MAKKIAKSDIAEDDVFGAIRKSAEDTISVIDQLSKALTETAEAVKKSIGGAKFDSTKSIDNFVKATTQANKLQQDAAKLEQQRAKAVEMRNKAMAAQQKKYQEVEKAEQQRKKTSQESLKIEQEKERLAQQRIRTSQAAAKEAERQAKADERAAKVAADEANAYKRLEKAIRDKKNESKQLAAQMLALESSGQKNSKEWRNLAQRYREVTREAQQGDKTLKQIDSTVGDNFRNVGNYTGALKSMGSQLMMLAGVGSAMSVFKNAAGMVVDFDQAQGDLLAISGKTREEMAGLTQQAKDLGATTQFSATQITNMQIELAKLGFTTDQISNSTAAVANFAAATGADIPEAAALAGSAMRGFGLEANEMERVVSTLGVATTKTALDFSALNTGLSTVAPVAKAFGFSIEDTTALLGQLANAGFDASSAATATRNIILNLADGSGDLAQSLGRPIKNADDLAAGLKELKDKGIDLATALELTDKRSVAAFNTFMDNSDTLVDLRDSITDVNDELEAMAEKRLDTIAGQMTLLQSAWEGFVLGVNEGSGAGQTLKNVIGFIAQNLNNIMSLIGRVILAWASYKGAILAAKAATWVMTGGLKAQYTQMMTSLKGLVSFKKGLDTAAAGATGFGKALNAVPWMAIIGVVIQLAQAFYEVANGAQQARLQQELNQKAAELSEKRVGALAAAEKKRYDEKMRQLDLEIRQRAVNGESEKKLEEERAARQKKIAKESVNSLKYQANQRKTQMAEMSVFAEQYQAFLKKMEKGSVSWSEKVSDASKTQWISIEELHKKENEYRKQFNKGKEAGDAGFLYTGEASDFYLRLATEATAVTDEVVKLGEAAEEYEAYLEEAIVAEEEVKKKMKDVGKVTTKVKKDLKDHNTEFKKQIDLNAELLDLARERRETELDINQALRDREIVGIERDIESEFLAQKTMVENTGNLEVDLLDDLVLRKAEIRKEAVKEQEEWETAELVRRYNEDMSVLKRSIEEEKAERLAANKEIYEQNLETFKGNAKKTTEAQENWKKAQEEIEANYQAELEKYRQIELAAADKLQTDITLVKEEAINERLAIEDEANEEIIQKNDELIEMQIQYGDKQKKNAEKSAEQLADIEKKMWEDRMAIAETATQFLLQLADRRIDKYDKEIAAAEKQADMLRELAINGNIDAKDSLAEQQRIIDEANRKKMIEERRKQKIEFANTVFQTYGSKVQSGSKSPLADTIRDTALLQQFISTFTPTFLEGTEDTGANGRGIDGKGGFHAILHPNERVMTKEQNAMVGGLSNEQLAGIAQDYQNGKLIQYSGATQMGNGWNTQAIINQLESLERTIKNKPEHQLDVENVVLGAMDIVRTTKTNGTTIYNRYRVRK